MLVSLFLFVHTCVYTRLIHNDLSVRILTVIWNRLVVSTGRLIYVFHIDFLPVKPLIIKGFKALLQAKHAKPLNALNAYRAIAVYVACVHFCVHRRLCVSFKNKTILKLNIIQYVRGAAHAFKDRQL